MKLLKKFNKNFRKLLDKLSDDISDNFRDFLEDSKDDIWEEMKDFIKDWKELFGSKKTKKTLKKINVYGVTKQVRPAFIFAERVENIVKLVFGVSIVISGIIASVWGFPALSFLLHYSISSIVGRIVLIFIGFCYLTVAAWKLMHVKE